MAEERKVDPRGLIPGESQVVRPRIERWVKDQFGRLVREEELADPGLRDKSGRKIPPDFAR